MRRINYLKPMLFARICSGCFLLLALAVLAPCNLRGVGWQVDQVAETATLLGNLTVAKDGSPMPGVFIILQSRFALRQDVTNEKGAFRISRIAPGDYLFKCSLPGFATMVRILHLQGGEIRQLDLKLNVIPTEVDVFTGGIIARKVYINDKIPFPGVKVTAVAKDFSQTVVSIENGEFRFFGLEKEGTYTLCFSHEAFPDITATCVAGTEIQPKTEVHFAIPWLGELPEPPTSRPESPITETFSFDWQAWEKAIGAVFIEKYGKDIVEFERREIAALIPKEKIDRYKEYFENGLKTDTGMTIIEGEENRWLETAGASGSQYRQVFKLGYNQGSLNATLKRKVYWKAEWQTFSKEWFMWIGGTERSKAEALMPKKKVNAYMKSFMLGLHSDTGISNKIKKMHAWLEAAFRFGFHYQWLFEKGYREGVARSAGDSLKYTKKIE